MELLVLVLIGFDGLMGRRGRRTSNRARMEARTLAQCWAGSGYN